MRVVSGLPNHRNPCAVEREDLGRTRASTSVDKRDRGQCRDKVKLPIFGVGLSLVLGRSTGSWCSPAVAAVAACDSPGKPSTLSADPLVVLGRRRCPPAVSHQAHGGNSKAHNSKEYVPSTIQNVVHDVQTIFRSVGNCAGGRKVEVTSCTSATSWSRTACCVHTPVNMVFRKTRTTGYIATRMAMLRNWSCSRYVTDLRRLRQPAFEVHDLIGQAGEESDEMDWSSESNMDESLKRRALAVARPLRNKVTSVWNEECIPP